MAQGSSSYNVISPAISYADGANLDAFGRLRTSQIRNQFDAQFTYDLQPLVYEQVTNGTGATIAHSSTERNALLTFSSTPTGGLAYMQSYQHFRYNPGQSQFIIVSFNFVEAATDVLKFAGYSDGSNGFECQLSGSTLQFVLYSDTSNGDQTAQQTNWNLDKLDGTGPSGLTIDVTKDQILIIDFQALYAGRVRMGFVIDGLIYYAHEFLHSNVIANPYIQNANLPIRVGMSCTNTVSTTMNHTCASVGSEGLSSGVNAYDLSTPETTVTAASGARTLAMAVRPKTTFNSITNRTKLTVKSVNIMVTGNNPILWELCVGQALTTPSYADINATYSAFEYDTAGTLSGSPAAVIQSGYVGASNNNDVTFSEDLGAELAGKFPITLDQSGAVRDLGTLVLLVTGIGGTSATRATLNLSEER